MTEIITNKLFLGDMFDANNEIMLKEKKINCIICLAEEVNISINNPNINIYKYNFQDNYFFDISLYFHEIEQIIDKEKIVLVNCAAGISRSSTIVIAYIMKQYEINLKDTFMYVKNKRNIICPNKRFLKYLFHYEREIFGRNSITWDEIVELCFYK